MIIARFSTLDGPRYGLVHDDQVVELRRSPFDGVPIDPALDAWGPSRPLSAVQLLAPCVPSKVVLASTNYGEVLRLFDKPAPDEPILFIKPSTAVIGTGEAIRVPPDTQKVTHEPELAVVIGRPCSDVPPAEAHRYILGYTCANDLSARDIQDREVHMTRPKGYDTFCPLGPWIVTDLDPACLRIRSRVNGEPCLETTTDDMIFGVAELVSFASRCMTLLPGDLISTGASGVGPARPGDVVEIEVEGIGSLANPVVERGPWRT